MIKLGPVVAQAINKEFPDNWKAIAIMMALPCEYFEKEKVLEIELGDSVISIKGDNTISTSAPLPKEMIATIIMEATKMNDAGKK